MTKSTLLLLLFFLSGMAQNKPLTHTFLFKGYSVSIKDEITDPEGNHIFVGTVDIKAEYSKDRDKRLDAIYKLEDYASDSALKGIIITTDKNYSITQLNGLHGAFQKILWDESNKCYWIGGSAGFLHNDFNYQISLTKLNAKKEIIGFTAIETEANTYFKDMVLKDGNLIVLGMKMIRDMPKTQYIPNIYEVSTTQFHDSKNFYIPRKIPNIIYQTETDYPKQYQFDNTRLFIKDDFVCFGIFHCIDTEYGSRFYRYAKGKAEYIDEFGNIEAYDAPYLIGFKASTASAYLLAYAKYYRNKLIIIRTDEYLQPRARKEFLLAYYADFNQMAELPNGKLVVLSVNKNKTWSYLIFDQNGDLLSEIDSNTSNDYYPSLFKIVKGNTVLCSFYKTKAEPTVLQELDLE